MVRSLGKLYLVISQLANHPLVAVSIIETDGGYVPFPSGTNLPHHSSSSSSMSLTSCSWVARVAIVWECPGGAAIVGFGVDLCGKLGSVVIVSTISSSKWQGRNWWGTLARVGWLVSDTVGRDRWRNLFGNRLQGSSTSLFVTNSNRFNRLAILTFLNYLQLSTLSGMPVNPMC